MKPKNKFNAPQIENETIEELSLKLLKANEQLKKEQKERAEMLSNISHDLRAPLTAIRSAVDLLRSGQSLTMDDYVFSLNIIDRRTKNLENLINDMYYLFCVEDTSKELVFQKVQVLPFLEEYFFDLEADSRYETKKLFFDAPSDLKCQINIDIQKMIRVLDNLMTNAAKYSYDGAAITLKAELSGANNLNISVIDTGIGIPSEAIPHIFNRTYTVSSSRTPDSSTGSGLGLSIVKAIIERMSGEVTCESIKGAGSTFTISLPVV